MMFLYKRNQLITSLAVVLSALLASCSSNPSPADNTNTTYQPQEVPIPTHPELGKIEPKVFPDVEVTDGSNSIVPTGSTAVVNFPIDPQAATKDFKVDVHYSHLLIDDLSKEYPLFTYNNKPQLSSDVDLSFSHPESLDKMRPYAYDKNLPILFAEGFAPVLLGNNLPSTTINTSPLLVSQSSVRHKFSLNLPKVFLNPGAYAFQGSGVTVLQVDGLADYYGHENVYTYAPQKIDIANVVGDNSNYIKLAANENHGFRVGSIIIGNRTPESSGLVPDVNLYYAELSDPSYGVGDIIIDGYNQVLPSIVNNSYTISYSEDPQSIYKNIERSLSLLTAQKYAPLLVFASGNADLENLKVPGNDYAKYLANLDGFGQSIHQTSALYHLLENDQISKDMIITTGVYYDPSKRLQNNMYQWYVNNLVPVDKQQEVRSKVPEPVIDDSKLAVGAPLDTQGFYSPLGAIKCGVVMYDCLSASYIYYQSMFYNANSKPGYEHGNTGTSFAVPVISAVAAMVKQQFPWMTASNLKTTLLTTATDIGNKGVDPIFGWGVVNAANALRGPAQFAFGDFEANLSYRTYRPDNVKPHVSKHHSSLTNLIGTNLNLNPDQYKPDYATASSATGDANPSPKHQSNASTQTPANPGSSRSSDDINRSHALDKAKQGIYGLLNSGNSYHTKDASTDTSLDHNANSNARANSNSRTNSNSSINREPQASNPSTGNPSANSGNGNPSAKASHGETSASDLPPNQTATTTPNSTTPTNTDSATDPNAQSSHIDTSISSNGSIGNNADISIHNHVSFNNDRSAVSTNSDQNAIESEVKSPASGNSATSADHNDSTTSDTSSTSDNGYTINNALSQVGKNIGKIADKIDNTNNINHNYINDLLAKDQQGGKDAKTDNSTNKTDDSTSTNESTSTTNNSTATNGSNSADASSSTTNPPKSDSGTETDATVNNRFVNYNPTPTVAPDFDAGHSNTVNLLQSFNSYFLNSISGDGGLIVNGGINDYLYIASVNSYTGNTIVNSGNLVLVAPSDIGVIYDQASGIPNRAVLSSNVYVNHLGRFYMIDSAVAGNLYNNGLLLLKNAIIGGDFTQTEHGTLFVDVDSNPNNIQGQATLAGQLKLISSPLAESTNQKLHRVVLTVEKGYKGKFNFDASAYTTALVDYQLVYTDKEIAVDTSLRSLVPALNKTESEGTTTNDKSALLKGAEHIASMLPTTQTNGLFHSDAANSEQKPTNPKTVDSGTQTDSTGVNSGLVDDSTDADPNQNVNDLANSANLHLAPLSRKLLANTAPKETSKDVVVGKMPAVGKDQSAANTATSTTTSTTTSSTSTGTETASADTSTVNTAADSSSSTLHANLDLSHHDLADHKTNSSKVNLTASPATSPELTLVGAAIETMSLDQLQKLFYRNAGTVYSDLRFVGETSNRNALTSFTDTVGNSFARNDSKIYGYLNYSFGDTKWSNPQETSVSGQMKSATYSGGVYTQIQHFNLGLGYFFNRINWNEQVDLISPTSHQNQTVDLGTATTKAHTLALNLGYTTTDSYYNATVFGNVSNHQVTRSSIYANDQSANFNTYGLGVVTGYGKQIFDLGTNGGVIFTSAVNWQFHYQGQFAESAQKSSDQATSPADVDLHQRQSAQLSLDAKSKTTWDAYSNLGLKLFKGFSLGKVNNYVFVQANVSQYLFTPTYSLDLNNSLAKSSVGSAFTNKTLLSVTTGYRLMVNSFSFNVNASYQYSSNWDHYQVQAGVSYGF